MVYGDLTLICGPMYSGKTTETLKRILWAKNGQNRPVYVFKPTFDTRYAETQIVSHDGLKATATNISTIPDIEFEPNAVIFLDEIQFFMEPHFHGNVIEWVKSLLDKNIEVVAAGLDMDWKGNPFEITANLLAMANNIHKKTAHCTVCGKPASKTFKLDQSTDSSVELGALESYESRCNNHWKYS